MSEKNSCLEHLRGEAHHEVHLAAVGLLDLPVDPVELFVEEALLEAEAGVHEDGQMPCGALQPQGLPVGIVERRHVRVGEEARSEGSGEPLIGEPPQLGNGGIHVGARTDGSDE